MSDAPEVIWAVTEPNDVSADILGDVYAQQLPDGMNGTPVKYVRADRIEALEANLAKAVAFLQDQTGAEWPYDEGAKRILAELTGGMKDD